MVISFFVGLCIGILSVVFLYNRKYKNINNALINTEDNYEEIIVGLKNEIMSYKDIVKSLNKEIENLKK